MTVISLSNLRPGGAVNVRQHGQKDGIKELAASIKAHGLIQPLAVRVIPGEDAYEVVDGNRRYAALKFLSGKKGDTGVDCIIRSGGDTKTREVSLAANVMRVQLHPVDEYEAYQQLADGGLAISDISARFGLSEKWVMQRLQLAALAPELRKDWRDGKLSQDQAEALSSVPDHIKQKEVWKDALRDKGYGQYDRQPDSLRRKMRESGVSQTDRRVTFVGLQTYIDAGGEFSEDLFTDNRFLKNVELLNQLVAASLDAVCKGFVADGWAWAKPMSQMGVNLYQVPKLDLGSWATPDEKAELENSKIRYSRENEITEAVKQRAMADPAARAQSGVVVDLSYEGTLTTYFLILLEAAPEASQAHEQGAVPQHENAAPPEPECPQLPWPTREALSEQLTAATAATLAASPLVALPALIATLRIRLGTTQATPLRLQPENKRIGGYDAKSGSGSWRTAFEEVALKSTDDQLAELATHVAALLDFRDLKLDDRNCQGWDRAACINSLTSFLPSDRFRAELASRFDPAAYFSKVPVSLIEQAVTAMTGGTCKAGKKSEKAAGAAAIATELGWLPLELRTPHYTGPDGRVEQQEAAE